MTSLLLILAICLAGIFLVEIVFLAVLAWAAGSCAEDDAHVDRDAGGAP